MTTTTYQVWNGEYWSFERIVADLSKMVRSIVAKTTPEEEIDDCMQDAWMYLYERLRANPQALGPDPRSKSPRHTRSYYANKVVWDAHKGSGFGPWTVTYRNRQIPESVIFRQDRELDEFGFGDVPGLDTVLFADEYHRNWMDEVDVRLDLEDAVERYLSTIRPKFLSRFAMAVLCILHDDITINQGAMLAGCCPDTTFRDMQESRLLLQVHLRDYQSRPKRFYKRKAPRSVPHTPLPALPLAA
jgi:hypothetical protein